MTSYWRDALAFVQREKHRLRMIRRCIPRKVWIAEVAKWVRLEFKCRKRYKL